MRQPDQIGQYTIKRLIASGGMGSVYEALQASPRRSVALKVVRGAVASEALVERLRYEAQLLARLRHPGIAQVYEAGTFDDEGTVVPFFAMEYIPNARSLTEFAREKGLSIRERLALFTQVCDAVHYGHQRGIIHRDLKPANILVDSSGHARVIDFGVARATDSDLRQTNIQTSVGELVGSVHYMSPEQFEADPADIDTRSDIYALGVVLFELLTGELPYDLKAKNIYEVAHIVHETRPRELYEVDKSLSGELAIVVGKALHKDRDQRYQSAYGLEQDIRRFLANEAITARPPSLSYQLRVLARRNRAVVASIGLAFVLLVAGVMVSLALLVRVNKEKERAAIAQDFLSSVIASAGPTQIGGQRTVVDVLDQASEWLAEGAGLSDPETEAEIRLAIGRGYLSTRHNEEADEQLTTALKLLRSALGDTHEKTLELERQLYEFYRVVGESEKGLESIRRIAAAMIKIHGETSIEALDWQQDALVAWDRAGRLDSALELSSHLLPICKKVHGERSEITVEGECLHAWLLMKSGQFAAAEELARRAYLVVSDSGDTPAALLRLSRSTLAGILIAQGRLDEARNVYGNRPVPDQWGIEKTFQGTLRLDDGQAHLLVFWETWCPWCDRAMPQMEALHRQYGNLGIDVVGLCQVNGGTTEEDINRFIREKGITFTIAKDNGRATNYFESSSVPSIRLVDKGQLLWEGYTLSSDRVSIEVLEGLVNAIQMR